MTAAARPSRMRAPRDPMGQRRMRSERRTKARLRELCEEVLASYRLAIGDDLVTNDDREVAEQYLRNLTPKLAG